MALNKLLASILCLVLFNDLQAQKGKDGVKTVSTANVKINEFTALTAPVAANSTILNVTSNALNTNARFTTTLTPGDLVMIIQMQGALIKLSPVPIFAPDSTYGSVYDYQKCGNYEFAEVKSTISTNQIELTCGLTNSYTSAGKTQIVRVPRYNSLNVTGSGTLTTDSWNSITGIGGVLAAEVDGATTIDGSVTATGLGFRGGVATASGGNNFYPFSTLVSTSNGSEKGEGIGSDRITGLTHDSLGKYCKGAPGNGGGGGNANNCGGGGGGNGGNISAYNGYGIISPGFNAIWDLEWPGRSSVTSSGGGKGGYGTSTTTTANINSVGPNDTRWGSFKRLSAGGYGGRPLDYSTGKLFMGGGGGAGHTSGSQSNGANACNGGNGGGLIYFLTYGTISGIGTITSNGANGNNAFGTPNLGAPQQGIDGGGGAGAGGTIILKSNGTISGITANAIGGNGGSQVKSGTTNSEGQGPGGGGSGGYIAGNGSVFTQNVNGGANGTTNATAFNIAFPMNGASSGDVGTKNQVISPSFSLTASPNQIICTNQSINLTATSTNTAATIEWYNSLSGNAISSGTVYTTPTYTAIGTYTVYAGSCPGIYRVPIVITVNNGSAITVNSPTICPGQTVTLTAGGSSTSYTWTTGSPNSTTVSVSPASTAIYTVNATSGSCIGTQTTQVVVSTIPTISVANNTICTGNSVTLTAVGTVTNYAWLPGGQTTSSIVVSPTISATYSVSGTDGTCSNNTTATVTVVSRPTISVPSATICAGTSTVLTASGTATSFTWMPGSITTPSISASTNTTYTITGSNSTCTNSAMATVTVLALPTVSVPNATICAGTSTVLTASGTATNFTWMPGNVTTPTISSNSNTTYTIAGSNGTCTNSTTATVTVVALPTVSVPGATICSGTSTVLTASGTATSFTWMPGNITTSTISANSNTNYTITGSNGSCTNSTTASVSVTPTPTLTANNTTICPNQTATFTVSGASSYTWNPGGVTGTTFTISPASSGTVSVTGMTGTCTAQITRSVTVNPTPTIAVTNQTICPSQTATLTVSGAANYTWSPGNITGNSYTIAPSSSTVVTIIGANGTCTTQTTASVTVSSGISISVNSPTICAGQTASLTASSANTYTWNTGALTNTLNVNPVATTIYTVSGTVGTCTGTSSSTVTVIGQPTLSVTGNTSICSGSSSTLSANGAGTYTWMPGGQTTASIVVNPNATATYTIIGSNGICSTSTTTTINVTSTPTLTTNSPTICPGAIATLTASGAATYTWNGGTAIGSTFTMSPSSSATVDVIGANGSCTASVTASVTVGSAITITAANATICPGSSTTLTANGATTYSWSAGAVNTPTIVVSPLTTTIYTINGASGSCTGTGTVMVNVTSSLTISVSGNTPICSGNTATLSALGAISYTWAPGGQLSSSITDNPNNTVTYTITGSDGTCTNTTTATLTVTPTPSLTSQSLTICAGQTATLTGSGATTYTWNPGNIISNSYTLSPASTTTIDMIGANGSCNSQITHTVNVGTALSVAINSQTICEGQTTILSATTSASSYTWNTGANTNSISVSPITNTIYTLDVSNGSCTGSNTVAVTVNPVPTLTASATFNSICNGQTTTLTVNGATTYTWSNSSNSNSQIVSPSSTTTYTVIGTSLAGCASTAIASTTINVTAIPNVSITSTPTICAGQTATLIATGATSYTWSTMQNGSSIAVNPPSNATYSVVGDNVGCTAGYTVMVTVTPSPSVTVNAANTTGCPNLLVSFTDNVNPSSSSISYNFGDGNTDNINNPTHNYTASGSYTVTATVTNTVLGCSSTYTLPTVIQVISSPVADFTIQEGSIVTVGSLINLTNTSSNATSYMWSLCGSVSTLTNVTTSYADTGRCCIVLLASNATCTNSVTKCISIVDQAVVVIPNVFTPNGDTKNDLFRIKTVGVKTLNCSIYDRWGLKMHEWDGINGYWDGAAKAGIAPDGTYFFIITYTDQLDKSTTEKGFLNLFRD